MLFCQPQRELHPIDQSVPIRETRYRIELCQEMDSLFVELLVADIHDAREHPNHSTGIIVRNLRLLADDTLFSVLSDDSVLDAKPFVPVGTLEGRSDGPIAVAGVDESKEVRELLWSLRLLDAQDATKFVRAGETVQLQIPFPPPEPGKALCVRELHFAS